MKAILGRERDKLEQNCFGHTIMGILLLFSNQEIGSIAKITSLPTFVRNKGKLFLISGINAYDVKIQDGLNRDIRIVVPFEVQILGFFLNIDIP